MGRSVVLPPPPAIAPEFKRCDGCGAKEYKRNNYGQWVCCYCGCFGEKINSNHINIPYVPEHDREKL